MGKKSFLFLLLIFGLLLQHCCFGAQGPKEDDVIMFDYDDYDESITEKCCNSSSPVMAACTGDHFAAHSFCKKCFFKKKLQPQLIKIMQFHDTQNFNKVVNTVTELEFCCPGKACCGYIDLKYEKKDDFNNTGLELFYDVENNIQLSYGKELKTAQQTFVEKAKKFFTTQTTEEVVIPVAIAAGVRVLFIVAKNWR